MEKIDYNKQMQTVARHGQTLLLHVCCAPCSAGVLPRLNGFTVVPYFYNPNIDTQEEYDLRAAQFCKLGVEPHICAYDPDEFLRAVRGLEEEKEGGLGASRGGSAQKGEGRPSGQHRVGH